MKAKDLIYNEISESIEDLMVQKDHNIYLQCAQCRSDLTFKVFAGDSLHIIPDPCPKCSKEILCEA